MRLTIVMGFFLPMPPVAGGATEKSWQMLAEEFARLGHEVTIISRTWRDWPDEEVVNGIRHRRFPGHDHTPSLLRNVWQDFRWSRRVARSLPPADVTVVNCIALPALLRRRQPVLGSWVVMTGRMPKGQYRVYGPVDRVLAVSHAIKDAIARENPAAAARARVVGYPIDVRRLAPLEQRKSDVVTLGYVGRVHREKGLDLLTDALALVARERNGPRFRFVLCGPTEIVRGGSGQAYFDQLQQRLGALTPAVDVRVLPAVFEADALAKIYQGIDVFCYPSLAAQGETFGVAVAEAMAAGAVPVVSQLDCFRDLVRNGENGAVFDHAAPNAAAQLASALRQLVADEPRRRQLAAAARASVQAYDVRTYAESLLADFAALR